MTDEALIRAAWPEYSVAGLLGHGTYGAVYHVRRTDMEDMDAAVKVIGIPADENDVQALRNDGFSDAQIAAWFERLAEDWKNEIHLMKRYQGMSHFVSIEDCRVLDREGDPPGKTILIRMEKLKSLPSYLSDKTLTEDEVIDLGIQMCEALSVCHRDGLIHRDIKPENIFVQDRDERGVLYKLGDFGATKQADSLSSSFSMKGAVGYMAPEILQTRQYDRRADIYSLGLTLYRLMNGNRLPFLPARQLFTHEDYSMAVRMRLSGAPLPPASDASPELNRVLIRACALDPKDRYASAEEFSKALEGISAAAAGKKDRRPLLRCVLPLCALLLCAGLLAGTGLWNSRKPDAAGNGAGQTAVSAPDAKGTPVPMLAAQTRPDPLRQALEAAEQRWEELCAGPPERLPDLAESPAFLKCVAAAPALSREAGSGILRTDCRTAGLRVKCVAESGKEYSYTYDKDLQGFVFRNIMEKEPEKSWHTGSNSC